MSFVTAAFSLEAVLGAAGATDAVACGAEGGRCRVGGAEVAHLAAEIGEEAAGFVGRGDAGVGRGCGGRDRRSPCGAAATAGCGSAG